MRVLAIRLTLLFAAITIGVAAYGYAVNEWFSAPEATAEEANAEKTVETRMPDGALNVQTADNSIPAPRATDDTSPIREDLAPPAIPYDAPMEEAYPWREETTGWGENVHHVAYEAPVAGPETFVAPAPAAPPVAETVAPAPAAPLDPTAVVSAAVPEMAPVTEHLLGEASTPETAYTAPQPAGQTPPSVGQPIPLTPGVSAPAATTPSAFPATIPANTPAVGVTAPVAGTEEAYAATPAMSPMTGPVVETPSMVQPSTLQPVLEPAPLLAEGQFNGGTPYDAIPIPSAASIETAQPTTLRESPSAAPLGMYDMASQTPTATVADGTGIPGPRLQEGPQSPQLVIEKIAPADPKIGVAATFKTVIRNVGTVTAQAVEVTDLVPQGTQLLSMTPVATPGPNQSLTWRFETIAPNEERAIEMELMPQREGEIGSVATVRFSASATARAVTTRPLLEVATSAPDRLPIGEQVPLRITVTNPGTGVATGVVLEEVVPEGLQHASGAELRYVVGDLKPNETKHLNLTMTCVKPGVVVNQLQATADGGLSAVARSQFEIVSPQLHLAAEGAKQRFLERQAVYQFAVSNPGTAPAEDIELAVYLPQGLRYEGTDDVAQGTYDAETHSVRWMLQQLDVGKQSVVEVRAMPIQAGQGSLRFVTKTASGMSAEMHQPIAIDGISALSYEVIDTEDPVEVGGATTYEIHVTNQGTKEAKNIRVAAELPPQLQCVSAEGPANHQISEAGITFAPLASLGPKKLTTYKLHVKGVSPGDVKLRVQVIADDMQSPVTEEESTRVFGE